MLKSEKFTNQAQEALSLAASLAQNSNNTQIEPEHLFFGLLEASDSLIISILRQIGVDELIVKKRTEESLTKLPKLAKPASQVYFSASAEQVIKIAEKKSQVMKDDYISSEHLFLGLLATANPIRQLLNDIRINEASVAAALEKIRGSQKVDSPAAESRYQVLEKYAVNLTQRAREEKLEPQVVLPQTGAEQCPEHDGLQKRSDHAVTLTEKSNQLPLCETCYDMHRRNLVCCANCHGWCFAKNGGPCDR